MWYSSAWGEDDALLMAIYDTLDFIDWIHDELIIYKCDTDPVHRPAFLEYLARKTGGRQVQFESSQRYLIDPESALEFQTRYDQNKIGNSFTNKKFFFIFQFSGRRLRQESGTLSRSDRVRPLVQQGQHDRGRRGR